MRYISICQVKKMCLSLIRHVSLSQMFAIKKRDYCALAQCVSFINRLYSYQVFRSLLPCSRFFPQFNKMMGRSVAFP